MISSFFVLGPIYGSEGNLDRRIIEYLEYQAKLPPNLSLQHVQPLVERQVLYKLSDEELRVVQKLMFDYGSKFNFDRSESEDRRFNILANRLEDAEEIIFSNLGKPLNSFDQKDALDRLLALFSQTNAEIIKNRINRTYYVFTYDDLKRRPNETFQNHKKRLNAKLEKILVQDGDTMHKVLSKIDSETINNEVVDVLIEFFNRNQSLVSEKYAKILFEELKTDSDFANFSNIDLNLFFKNNPNYDFIKKQIFSEHVEFDSVIQKLKPLLAESEAQRLHRKTREKQKAKNMATPGAAPY